MTLGLIWAQSLNGIFGQEGKLPWTLPEDLTHFRNVTLTHPVIMGRKTWESLPARFRPLPGRKNLVISQTVTELSGAEVFPSLEEALESLGAKDAWDIGGSQLLSVAQDLAQVAYVTTVELEAHGDVHAPRLGSRWHRNEELGLPQWQTSATGIRFKIEKFHAEP